MTRREFPQKVCVAAFKRAGGHCEGCGSYLWTGKFHYDHRIPDGLTGEPTLENCQVLCRGCHVTKTAADLTAIAKAKRREAKHLGAKRSSRPMPGSRASGVSRKFNGDVVRR